MLTFLFIFYYKKLVMMIQTRKMMHDMFYDSTTSLHHEINDFEISYKVAVLSMGSCCPHYSPFFDR